MSRLVKCDVCGVEQKDEVSDMYTVTRNNKNSFEQCDVCEDCMPNDIVENTHTEYFD